MQLPLRLKALRKETGETQDEIAKMLHVQRSTYGEYERGKIRPPANKLFLLAYHYDVSVDYLVGISDFRKLPNHPQNDVAGHVGLFVNWLRNPNATPELDGMPLDEKERELLISQLENAYRVIWIHRK